MKLTFTHATSTILFGNVITKTITTTIRRFWIVAQTSSKLLTIWTTRRPWWPRCPFSIDCWTYLIARLFLNGKSFTSRSIIDGSRIVTNPGSFPYTSATCGTAFWPVWPIAPLSRHWNKSNRLFYNLNNFLRFFFMFWRYKKRIRYYCKKYFGGNSTPNFVSRCKYFEKYKRQNCIVSSVKVSD